MTVAKEAKETKETTNKTEFDRVFRTMMEKMPRLLVPVINEVFSTNYPDNVRISQLKNEHYTRDGKIITDSCINIRQHIYHIECQSTSDGTMAVRMIEYDFSIALEHVQKKDDAYVMRFPHSCVIYLRHTAATPDELTVEVILQDEERLTYKVPILKVQKYSKDEIFQKRLLFFLPFYIMRYEKQVKNVEENSSELEAMLCEFIEIRLELERELIDDNKSVLYDDLVDIIKRIADYVFRDNEEVKEEVKKTMVDDLIELKSERDARILREKLEAKTEEVTKEVTAQDCAKLVASLRKYKVPNNEIVKELMEQYALTKKKAEMYLK